MALASDTLYYLAYGSNLHPVRLLQRVASASLLDIIPLQKYRLRFHKKSHDGSSKCNIQQTEQETDNVYTALYSLRREHKRALDHFEGLGNGYQESTITVESAGINFQCFIYLAQDSHIIEDLQPYHWYRQLVILGAKYHRFPASYIAQIEAVESIADADSNRLLRMDSLIQEIMKYAD